MASSEFKRNAKEEYKLNHIKNSIFFDIDKYSDQNSPLPHMLPSRKIGKILYLVLELKILIRLLFMIIRKYLVHVVFGIALFTLVIIQI